MKTAKDFLFSKYPLVSPEWFDDNELTKEMIMMMEQYARENLREELIKFVRTNFDLFAKGNMGVDTIVDEYLKQKK